MIIIGVIRCWHSHIPAVTSSKSWEYYRVLINGKRVIFKVTDISWCTLTIMIAIFIGCIMCSIRGQNSCISPRTICWLGRINHSIPIITKSLSSVSSWSSHLLGFAGNCYFSSIIWNSIRGFENHFISLRNIKLFNITTWAVRGRWCNTCNTFSKESTGFFSNTSISVGCWGDTSTISPLHIMPNITSTYIFINRGSISTCL